MTTVTAATTALSTRRWDRRAWAEPRPNAAVARVSTTINRLALMPRQRVRVQVPDADAARLADLVGKPAFLAPNHPEFLTDWLIDKELCDRAGLDTASWADQSIVNMNPLMQRFWLANHLVANVPGGGGVDYSVDWAARGRSVLLHPEGRVSWRNDRVGSLLPGLARMAIGTARRLRVDDSVFVQPVVWKLVFSRDVTPGLHREMALIEHRLGLQPGTGTPAERFGALVAGVTVAREQRFGLERGPCAASEVFDRQERLYRALMTDLVARHGDPGGGSYLTIHRLRRAVKAAGGDPEDLARLAELDRLCALTPDVYGSPVLTQEQIAEHLKHLRQHLLTSGRDQLAALFPKPVGPRIAHVSVPEPIVITRQPPSPELLTTMVRQHMQGALDCLGYRLHSALDQRAEPNPLTGR
jgi:hypothetical protein